MFIPSKNGAQQAPPNKVTNIVPTSSFMLTNDMQQFYTLKISNSIKTSDASLGI